MIRRWVYNMLDTYADAYHFNWDVKEKDDTAHISVHRTFDGVKRAYAFHIPLKVLNKTNLTCNLLKAIGESIEGFW